MGIGSEQRLHRLLLLKRLRPAGGAVRRAGHDMRNRLLSNMAQGGRSGSPERCWFNSNCRHHKVVGEECIDDTTTSGSTTTDTNTEIVG